MLMAGFEPAIPTSMRSQTNQVDDAANGFGLLYTLPFQTYMSVSTTRCLAAAVLPGPLSAAPTSPTIQLSDFIVCHATTAISHYLNTSPSSDDDTFVEGFSFRHERYKYISTFTPGISYLEAKVMAG